MTEDQIERHVERKIYRLDRAFMAFKINQAEYDSDMKEIRAWADVEYRFAHNFG